MNLDDNEGHYAKVMLDEVFGRECFLGTVVWEKSDSPRMDALFFSSRHDYLFCYGRDRSAVKFQKLKSSEVAGHYNRTDEDGRLYYTKPLRAMGGQGDTRVARPNLYFALVAPDGTEVYPKKQDGSDGAWRWSADKCAAEAKRIEWVQGRTGWTPYYRIYADNIRARPPETIWPHGEVGSNRTSKSEVKALLDDAEAFGTPKPERLLKRVIEIATTPGDWVLDSFAGSGTTGAVAHKMGRRWIMVELGDHCHTHIIPRMKKVISGDDQGGISNTVDWKGGGGFRYYKLGPSLIVKDEWENPVINPEFNAGMLTEAMCKLEGFTFEPNSDIYWQQGRSSEMDFIYVTTQMMTREMLVKLSEEVGSKRSLLICCSAFRCDVSQFENLNVKKIPKAVLKKCEWGHDDYSLEIRNLPQPPAKMESAAAVQPAESKRPAHKYGKGKDAGPTLFDMEGAHLTGGK